MTNPNGRVAGRTQKKRYSLVRNGDVKAHFTLRTHGGKWVLNIALPGVHGGPAVTREFDADTDARAWVAKRYPMCQEE